jgi:hypothetical protein
VYDRILSIELKQGYEKGYVQSESQKLTPASSYNLLAVLPVYCNARAPDNGIKKKKGTIMRRSKDKNDDDRNGVPVEC